MKIDEKVYFKVYEKYLKALGSDGTSEIELELTEDTQKFLMEKSKEYGVSLDVIISGYLELQIHDK